MPIIPIGGEFYRSPSLPISAQECVGLYANIPQAIAPTKMTLLPPAGLKLATTAGATEINRGGTVFQGVPYVVNGSNLYRIDRATDAMGTNTYSAVAVNGAVSIAGSGRVMMSDNGAEGDQLCIIAPDVSDKFNAYIYTLATTTFVAISDTDFDGPVSSVQYVDGYFLFTKSQSQKLFVSNLRDGLAYTATDFVLSESDPDNISGSWILNNEPVIFGTQSFEHFQNVGGAGFPFQRVQGAVQDKGLKSKFAVQEVNNAMIFLGASEGETPAIWASTGGTPEKLSTTAIDTELSSYTQGVIEAAFAFKYSQSGAQFVGFTFPTKKTFIYDFTTGKFHTRESRDASGTTLSYRVCSIMDAYGILLVGDCISSKIGILDQNTFNEYGDDLRRRFVTPQIDNEGSPFWLNSLELWLESGVGLTTGQGSDPEILMSYSKDGGKTFSNPISRKIGEIGEYSQRVIWNSLGRFGRQVCFKFEMSDPVKWSILQIEASFN
jgi:hypothetical protein|tara:strand:+ start:799 stop:2274 length:1476 start_codon:yes stop_codon:yes gene_type:complete